jgi:alanyl-tRNA synthetase
MRNHTATHLLHARCARCWARTSSRPAAWSSRRACASISPITPPWTAEIEEVERLVNQQILRNTRRTTNVMPLDQAIATGAMALFGEKYGEEVRVVSIPGFSKELCGGTHVAAPAISAFARSSTKAASRPACGASKPSPAKARCASIRRPPALPAPHADLVRASEPELVEHVEKMLANERAWSKVDQLKEQAGAIRGGRCSNRRPHTVNGARVLAARPRWHGPPADALAGRFAAQQVEKRRGGAGFPRRTARFPSSPRSPRTSHPKCRPASW